MLRRVRLNSRNLLGSRPSLKKFNSTCLTSNSLNLNYNLSPLSVFNRPFATVNNIMDTLTTPPLIQPNANSTLQNVLLNFSLNADQITQLGGELLDKSKQILDQVASVPAAEANFATVIQPLSQIEAYRSIFAASSYFPQYISTSSEVRKASAEITQKLEAFEIESKMRQDIYKSVQNAIKNINLSELNSEDQRFISKLQLDFKRNGLDLESDKLEKLKGILTKISENSIKFSLAIAEDKTTVEFTEKELEGVPKDFLEGLTKKKSEASGEEVFVIGMKPPEITPIMELCRNAESRRKVNLAYGSRCKDNVALLEETVKLRDQAAHLVGYKNHSEYQLAIKMAKSPEKVYEFLDDLKTKLTPLAHKELEILLEYKKREVPEADKINAWDIEYYKAQWLKEKYNVDHDLIRKYFPMEHVVENVFKLFGEEFDLNFEKVTNDFPSWLPPADPKVDLIKVSDKSNNDVIGYFYVDLFPRDGKFTHAALFPLQFGSPKTTWANNQSQPSVGAMVCNFPPPTPSQPSLLKHNDVVTFCHELGHVLHHICSKTHYSRFHGTNVEHDFVETPSQLMENWCWEPTVLKRLSKHHSTGEPLPDDAIECLIGSKNAGAGLFWLRQLLFCYFDMEIHTKPNLNNLDTTALYDKIREEVSLVPNQAGTFAHATIGHFMGGYDAGYYGYLWSLVYATDIYYTLFKGSHGGQGGRNFRENVLLKGGSVDGMDLLKKSLGREPSSYEFLKSLNIL